MKKLVLLLLPTFILTCCGEVHHHTYSEEWTALGSNGHTHMATCEHKNLHTEVLDHEYVKTTVDPTESSLGYDHYVCKVCQYSYDDNYVAPEEASVDYELEASLRKKDSTKEGGYQLSFDYKDSYFASSATVFNKDLALLSSGLSMMAESEESVKKFYSSLVFDNIQTHYVTVKTENTVSYAFAHRYMPGYDLVSLVVNGHNYGLEWSNNALLGKSGDHLGFSLRATEIYKALKAYASQYSNVKLWISGYSRGAAISNVLSHYVLSKDEMNVSKENMFVYTFECPNGLSKEHSIAYENVFNVIYSGDFVTHLSPVQYGFGRCGIDVDLYTSSEETDRLLHEFDEDIEIPEFTEFTDLMDDKKTIKSEQEAMESIMAYILRDGEDDENFIYFPTREDYVNKEQSTVQILLSIVFGLPSETLSKIMADFQALSFTDILAILSSGMALYQFIKPYLDEAQFPYIDVVLQAGCTMLIRMIGTDIQLILQFYQYMQTGNSPLAKSLIRSIKVHYPEVGYVLLKNYSPAE